MAKSQYAELDTMRLIIGLLQPDNGLAMTVALETGLRINDVLRLKRTDVRNLQIHYVAQKTGKAGTAKISKKLADRLRHNGYGEYIFPGTRSNAHRTRQAVYLDVKKVCTQLGVEGQISPHSARKTFAVNDYHEHGLKSVKEKLQHSSESIAMLYALSDINQPMDTVEINEKIGLILTKLNRICTDIDELKKSLDKLEKAVL